MKIQKIIEGNFYLTENLTPVEYVKLTEVLGIDPENPEIIPAGIGTFRTGSIRVKGNFHKQILKILIDRR